MIAFTIRDTSQGTTEAVAEKRITIKKIFVSFGKTKRKIVKTITYNRTYYIVFVHI